MQATVLFNPDTGETAPCAPRKTRWTIATSPIPTCRHWVSDEDLARIKAAMPELPAAKCDRFIREYGLSKYDATLLITGRRDRQLLRDGGQGRADAKLVANWMLGELPLR